MRRSALFALLALLVLTPIVGAFPIQDRYRFEVTTYTQAQPALVSRYGLPVDQMDIQKVRYQPRQFAAGATVTDEFIPTFTISNAGQHSGWDVLDTFNLSSHRKSTAASWLTFSLQRDATVGLIWRGSSALKPAWLTNGSWTQFGTITLTWPPTGSVTYPVYRKAFAAGDQSIPGVNYQGPSATADQNTYWLLFAEANGSPSPTPLVPEGIEDIPTANQPCPAWVHDLHVTDVNGVTYRTWHPQIDPVYWCYYGHEHGTDPAYYDPDWMPAFGLLGLRHGMTENHHGFKFYVFDHDGYRFGVMIHQGTSGLGRVCQQYHEVIFRVKKISTGEEVANLNWIGNFGAAIENDTGARLTPSACPNQGLTDPGNGNRLIPVYQSSDGTTAIPTAYEPWRISGIGLVNGTAGSNFVVNANGVMDACMNVVCNSHYDMPNASGASRFLTPNEFRIVYSAALHGANGQFCHDMLAENLIACSDPMAVAGYIKPGFSYQFNTPPHFTELNGWGTPLLPYTTGVDAMREGSIPGTGNN